MVDIVIQQGDLTKVEVEAIVNPANSFGVMGGGVAGVIKRVGGQQIEQEAMAQAPIPLGLAISTTAGSLPCQSVIHAPTMRQPAELTDADIVARATKAALECAERLNLRSLAIPGMGTGVGRVPVADAAHAMVETIRQFPAKSLQRVVLVDLQAEMVKAFRAAVAGGEPGAAPLRDRAKKA
jgi:O-acetyl-ADP-ribose deacetylase (regulator of RNase III)